VSAGSLATAVVRRLLSAHKPVVRLARRLEREREQRAFRRGAEAVDRDIARVAAGGDPIVVGPWLAEVGYEALYWLPFVRWFQDRFAVSPERLWVLSRGGVGGWYEDTARHYVDLFDLMPPAEVAARNAARQTQEEGGGQKQSALSAFDEELLSRFRQRTGVGRCHVLHPSMMFTGFRHVWHHNLPFDFLWRRTRFARMTLPAVSIDGLAPKSYIAVKVYSGVAVPMTEQNRRIVRSVVQRAAARAPVVLLDADLPVDEHRDFVFDDIPNVRSARALMTPGNNLGVQSGLLAGASLFIGTCGGLAWMAPLLGVPTVAVYDDDRLLDSHLMVAKQVYKRVQAASFTTLDLRAWTELRIPI
jgi:hypothetical protein